MDCSHARLLLLFDGPGPSEFSADDAASLKLHLGDCRSCRSLAQKQQAVDAVLGQAMRKVEVPGDLERRIFSRLQRERRPNPWPWVAAVGVVLVAAGMLASGWYYLRHSTRPHFDHELFQQMHFGASPEVIEESFRKKGVAMKVPSDLNPKYLDSWEVVWLQGKQVAKLTYVKDEAGQPAAMVQVYVIPKDTFDAEFAAGARSDTVKEEGPFFFLSIIKRGTREAFVGDAK